MRKRILLPLVVIALGAVLIAPLASATLGLSDAGAPDATALALDTSLVVRVILGVVLLGTGLALLLLRTFRRRPARSA